MIQSDNTHSDSATAKLNNTPFSQQLRAYLQKCLPEYMVPAVFVVLEALPATASGKVDYRALPLPDQDPLEAQPELIPPRTEVEKVLADIWARTLAVKQVGVEDNFFQIGGHSLLVIQIIARIREALQVELPLRVFFETPTIAILAKYIETLRWMTQDALLASDSLDLAREEGEI